MVTIHTRARVHDDGRLTLDLPTGLDGATVEVTVLLRPIQGERPDVRPSTWPEGFIEQTYGSCADDPVELPPPLPPDIPRDTIE